MTREEKLEAECARLRLAEEIQRKAGHANAQARVKAEMMLERACGMVDDMEKGSLTLNWSTWRDAARELLQSGAAE